MEELLSEIGLGSAPAGPPVTKEPLYIRDLTAEDIQSLSKRAAYGSQQGQLTQKLRAPHHTLARLIAEGKKHPQCALITGYTVEYIVMMERDPAFKELVAYYKDNVVEAYANVHERLAELGGLAMDILKERMSDPEQVKKMTPGALREIMNDALDRSVAPSKVNQGGFSGGGHDGPKTLNINFVQASALPADTLPAARALPATGQQPKFIDVTPKEPQHGT
jgi:hypothetical protein